MASTRCRRRTRLVLVGVFAAALVALIAGFVARGLSAGADGAAVGDVPSATGDQPGTTAADGLARSLAELVPDLGEALEQGGSTVSERSLDADLSSAAATLLEEYEEEPGTLLAHSGWLDLTGHVWGCVVLGPGWVDVCLAEDGRAHEGTRVQTLRMEVSEWRDSYGDVQGEPQASTQGTDGPVER